jgi:hypothetical protein
MPSKVAAIPNLLRGEGLASEVGIKVQVLLLGLNWNISWDTRSANVHGR